MGERSRNFDLSAEKTSPHQEIERKFVVAALPDNLSEFPKTAIEQGYLATGETEVRLRKEGDEHFLTVKRGTGLVRDEEQISLTFEDFQRLWPLTAGKRVSKDRYKIPHGKSTIELDVYKDSLEGLAVAEVEFDSVDKSKEFIAPFWFAADVTADAAYKTQHLAKAGKLPPDLALKMSASENGIVVEQSLKDGVSKLIGMVEAKVAEQEDGPVFVMVAGRSSSGKTSAVTAELVKKFGDDISVLSMDDYSKGEAFVAQMAEQGTPINWDHPFYMDFALIREHLAALARGETIDKPTFSFKTGERDVSEKFAPKKVIVVEGLFALRDELKDFADVKAFVDISLHGSIVRRLLRDVQRTNMEPAQILKYYLGVVEPMYQEHIAATKNNADVVLLNEYNPDNESGRTGLYEAQTKFKLTNIDFNRRLRRAGAEFLGQVRQEDYYLQPIDSIPGSGESVRIRRQGNKTTFAYKGPAIDSEVRIKPKFEFEIDEETENALLERYGHRMRRIVKTRDLYQLGEVTICSDTLEFENPDQPALGNFAEIRVANKEDGEEIIRQTCEKLGLNYEERIDSSYLELMQTA